MLKYPIAAVHSTAALKRPAIVRPSAICRNQHFDNQPSTFWQEYGIVNTKLDLFFAATPSLEVRSFGVSGIFVFQDAKQSGLQSKLVAVIGFPLFPSCIVSCVSILQHGTSGDVFFG